MQATAYSIVQCYAKALERDPRDAKVWHSLGAAGGGTVQGTAYSAAQCFAKGLELDPRGATAWHILGRAGGGTVCSLRRLSGHAVGRLRPRR